MDYRYQLVTVKICIFALLQLLSSYLGAESPLPLAKVIVTSQPVHLWSSNADQKPIPRSKYVYSGDRVVATDNGAFKLVYLGAGVTYSLKAPVKVLIADPLPSNSGTLLIPDDDSRATELLSALARKFTIQTRYTGTRRDNSEAFDLPRSYTVSDSFREIVWRNLSSATSYEIVVDGNPVSQFNASQEDVLVIQLPELNPGPHHLEVRVNVEGSIQSSESILVWLDQDEDNLIAKNITELSSREWGDELLVALLLEKHRLDSAAYIYFEKFFAEESDSALQQLRVKNDARLLLD